MQLKRIIILALVGLFAAQAQSPPPQAEVFRGYVATTTALPNGHPLPIQMRVSPDGRTLAYEGENGAGEQALYLLRRGTDVSWRYIGTPASLTASLPAIEGVGPQLFKGIQPTTRPELGALTLSNQYVWTGTVSSRQGQMYWTDTGVLVNIADLTHRPAVSVRRPVEFRPFGSNEVVVLRPGSPSSAIYYIDSPTFSPTGNLYFLLNGRVIEVPLSGGPLVQVSPVTGLFSNLYALSDTELLVGDIDGAYQLVSLPSGASAPNVSLRTALGINYQFHKSVGLLVRIYEEFEPRKFRARVVALDPLEKQVKQVVTDQKDLFYEVTPSDFSRAGGLVTSRRWGVTDGYSSELLVFNSTTSATSVLLNSDNVILGKRLAFVQGNEFAGSIHTNTPTVDDNGNILFAASLGRINPPDLQRETPIVIRLTLPRPTSITPSPVQQGQDFTVTGDFLAFAGLKTDLVLGTGAPVDACVARSESELRCSSANFPVGSTTLRVRVSDARGNVVISPASVPITITAPALPISVTRFAADPLTLAVGDATTVCFATSEPPSSWAISWTGLSGTTREFGVGDVIVGPPRPAIGDTCVRFTQPETGDWRLRATARGNTALAGPVRVVVTDPRPKVTSLFNPFSHEPVTTIAPGLWVEVYGERLAKDTVIAQPPYPILLAETTIRINLGAWESWGRLWFVSPNQVNMLVPFDMPIEGKVMITVITPAGESAPVVLDAEPTSVGLLQSNGTAYSAGDVAVIYAVGLGRTTPPASSDEPAPLDQLMVVDTTGWTVKVNGLAGQIPFAGLTPGYIGLYQINVRLPEGLPVFGKDGPQAVSGKLQIGGREHEFSILLN